MADIKKRMLVFEDLREQQFKCEDKFSGLNVEHLKLALSTLAKWHAGTATLLLTVRTILNEKRNNKTVNFPSFRTLNCSNGIKSVSTIEMHQF